MPRIANALIVLAPLLFAGCASTTETKPNQVDSDVAGRPLPKVELKRCKPQTSTGPIVQKARLPKYPVVEFFKNKPGEVVLKFDVTESGSTEAVEIVRSTSQGFSAQVLSAVGKWQFTPAKNGTDPVRVTCTQKHQFERR